MAEPVEAAYNAEGYTQKRNNWHFRTTMALMLTWEGNLPALRANITKGLIYVSVATTLHATLQSGEGL